MPAFKCIAAGCTVVAPRARPPLTCPDRNRCVFEVFDPEAVAADPKPVEPLVPLPPPVPAAPPLRLRFGGETQVAKSPLVLGRNGDFAVELFRQHLGISRRHCELKDGAGVWKLTALTAASPTVLDGRVVEVGQEVMLRGPLHRLVLGEAIAIELSLENSREDPASSSDEFRGALDEFLNS